MNNRIERFLEKHPRHREDMKIFAEPGEKRRSNAHFVRAWTRRRSDTEPPTSKLIDFNRFFPIRTFAFMRSFSDPCSCELRACVRDASVCVTKAHQTNKFPARPCILCCIKCAEQELLWMSAKTRNENIMLHCARAHSSFIDGTILLHCPRWHP